MKNFTKILSLLLAFVLVLGTITVVSADREFSDLSASHWAYANVQTLVADGTINGYQDGTFRPDAGVTRAEFVKMIGKTDKSFEKPFDDISGHWAYDYIMYSDMDVEGTSFRPDEPMTRGDIVALLWKRAGSPVAVAPSIITNQSNNSDAAAWAYAYGIMNGDDGVNLRLEDGVTRAEASALICRSRTIDYSAKKVFADTVNPAIPEIVFNSLDVFDSEYVADKTFTNGELAHAAMRLAYEDTIPTFDGLNVEYRVERPYAFAFSILCNYVWGADKQTEEFYDAKANNLDAITALLFAANIKSSGSIISYSLDGIYDDVKVTDNDSANAYASAAFNLGILLENSNSINPTATITCENLALVLMQLDALFGFNSIHYLNVDASLSAGAFIDTEITRYPNNSGIYKHILTEVPNEVYNSAFVDENGKVSDKLPKDSFKIARDFSHMFVSFLINVSTVVRELGADVTIRYYPSLVTETDSGYALKVRIQIGNIEEGKTFDDMFPNTISGDKPSLKQGSAFYATIATGSKITSVNIPIDNATFTSIDYIY